MADIQQKIEAEIPGLRRYARALAHDVVRADDLVQECLARAIAKLHLWQEGTDLRAWLFTILHNQHVNHIRRSVREGITLELSDVTPLSLSQSPDQEQHLGLRDLDRALGQLPAEQRSAILLVGLEGMPYEDAAAVLGVPIGTVRSRLSRGRQNLRELMDLDPHRQARRETRPRTSPRRRDTSYLPAAAERSVLAIPVG
jgi:RNA polymerase sigma-70 factor (ECF subfamily)